MDDAEIVRRFEGFRNLTRNQQGLVDWQRAARDALRKIVTLDQFQNQRGHAIRFFQAVDVRDVRVVECGQDVRFATETCQPIGITTTLGRSTLIATSRCSFVSHRAIDLAHAAGAEERDDFVGTEMGAGRERQSGWIIRGQRSP